MVKVTSDSPRNRRFYRKKRDTGSAVGIKVFPPDTEKQEGGVCIYLHRRITTADLWRKFVKLPIAWSGISRNKRTHVTAIILKPHEVLLLRDAVNFAIEEAGIAEESDYQPTT